MNELRSRQPRTNLETKEAWIEPAKRATGSEDPSLSAASRALVISIGGFLGLRCAPPQALRCRPLRGLDQCRLSLSNRLHRPRWFRRQLHGLFQPRHYFGNAPLELWILA